MDRDAKRLDWLCDNHVSVSHAKSRGEWRVYDYASRNYIGLGASAREAIDNAMIDYYGEDE